MINSNAAVRRLECCLLAGDDHKPSVCAAVLLKVASPLHIVNTSLAAVNIVSSYFLSAHFPLQSAYPPAERHVRYVHENLKIKWGERKVQETETRQDRILKKQ